MGRGLGEVGGEAGDARKRVEKFDARNPLRSMEAHLYFGEVTRCGYLVIFGRSRFMA